MPYIISIVKLVSILVAAILVGSMFLKESKKAQAEHKAWYAPYASLPGALVLLCLLLPIIVWLIKKIR